MKIEQKILSLTGQFTSRYVFEKGTDPETLYLLLHGYSLSGEAAYKQFSSALPKGAMVLAPNGPFPVPVSEGRGYKVGFSWYFYETNTDEYYINMKLGCSYLAQLLRDLGLNSVSKKVIGYSQGGYLAPFAAEEMKNVTHLIGVNCQFLDEELNEPPKFIIDSVQGQEDDIVNPEISRRSHEKLVGRGAHGKYVLVPGAGHGVTPSITDAVAELLLQS